MQKIILFLCMSFGMICSYGQNTCTKTPFNCSSNLITELYSANQIVSLFNISYAKVLLKAGDVNYYSQIDAASNDCGTNTPDCNYDGAALTYDVYYPNKFSYPCYSTQPLPAIFLFAGSGFSDCSDDSEGTADYCLAFAKRGFIAFNVNYRKGRLKTPSGELSASQLIAMYRSFQDGRGAIRTAIFQNDNREFKIDTSNIFVGGISAGGEIALNIAYCPTESMNQDIFKDIPPVLGPINADYYKGPATISYSIRGVLNLWGAAFLTSSMSATDFLKQNKINPPLIAFHGSQDNVLFPITTKAYVSRKDPYNTESKCLLNKQTYTVPAGMNYLYQSGSSGLYDILMNQLYPPVPSELYLDSDMGHGLDLKADFGYGLGKVTREQLKIYFVQRAATFFQTVMNERAKLISASKFQDCINYRIRACKISDLLDLNTCMSAVGSTTSLTAKRINTPGDFTITQSNKIIKVGFPTDANSIITLFDINGRAIKNSHSHSLEISIDCTDVGTGLYLLFITQGTQTIKRKIFLQ